MATPETLAEPEAGGGAGLEPPPVAEARSFRFERDEYVAEAVDVGAGAANSTAARLILMAGGDPDRMSRVDRNVLRLAVHELMTRADVPASVVINEAIEISYNFV